MNKPIHFVTKKFKKYREDCDWTQEEMANFLTLQTIPMSRPEINYLETGKRGLTADKALAISKALNIPVMELVITKRND